MSDAAERPGYDACLISVDWPEPTPFQVACQTMLVDPSDEAEITTSPFFTTGWEVGIENSLNVGSMPAEVGGEADEADRKSWLVGFVAGQYALIHGNNTPFCVFDSHGSDCAAHNGKTT